MEHLKIYIDRLAHGGVFERAFELPGSFLEVSEPDLKFPLPIKVECKSYLAEDHLVVDLSASTEILMPCAVCNKEISLPLEAAHAYLAVPLDEIKGHVYNYGPFLRESLLLELPSFAECKGSCEERPMIAKFLKKEGKRSGESHFPFSNLD